MTLKQHSPSMYLKVTRLKRLHTKKMSKRFVLRTFWKICICTILLVLPLQMPFCYWTWFWGSMEGAEAVVNLYKKQRMQTLYNNSIAWHSSTACLITYGILEGASDLIKCCQWGLGSKFGIQISVWREQNRLWTKIFLEKISFFRFLMSQSHAALHHL